VPRKSNVFGQVETDTSVDSAVKKVPEFSEIKGPFEIKLLVLEPAVGGGR